MCLLKSETLFHAFIKNSTVKTVHASSSLNSIHMPAIPDFMQITKVKISFDLSSIYYGEFIDMTTQVSQHQQRSQFTTDICIFFNVSHLAYSQAYCDNFPSMMLHNFQAQIVRHTHTHNCICEHNTLRPFSDSVQVIQIDRYIQLSLNPKISHVPNLKSWQILT